VNRSSMRIRRRPLFAAGFGALLAIGATVMLTAPNAEAAVPFPVASIDGIGNNVANPTWGAAGQNYSRVAPARYVDGRSQPFGGPNSRNVSNRIFSDIHQNKFSERGVTQWGFVWGQFLDHTFGLRDDAGETANIPFNASDPLEEFTNTLGNIPFVRSRAAPGTGVTNVRQQINTENSYIDAETVYGASASRLEWLREGPVDGNMANNSARLLMPNNFLPRRDARGNPASAPTMAVDGRMLANPNSARVAGDVRANENIALNATHTLFAREHNRIVGLLPASLSEEDKFQIARRIVIAEQQYITYNEFLPAMGVTLPAYTGYNPSINVNLSNEFAATGYRAHSMIHGELESEAEAADYTQAQLDAIEAFGVEIEEDGDELAFVVPLNVAFFNSDLVPAIGLGAVLRGVGLEPQYSNDEQIDNQLRSVLFQVPVTGNPECLDGPTLPECFQGVVDLGAIDIERGRDHGIGTYNQLRAAYGLPVRTNFTQITGEATELFPADPLLTPGNEINDPNSMDITQLRDDFNLLTEPLTDEGQLAAQIMIRRTTTAARLRALYGNVNNLDAFTGMLAERHAAGIDMGELQRAIWAREFRNMRDGDRFFYGNDQGLSYILSTYGIDFRTNLGDVISRNTGLDRAEMAPNVFFDGGHVAPVSCTVMYRINSQWGTGSGGFNVTMKITNTGNVTIPAGWTLRFAFANGQQIYDSWSGTFAQEGPRVPVDNPSNMASIAPGQSREGTGFNATWTGTNARPTFMSVNNVPCAITTS
jgi:hypothetical protein